jgi:hypothetical protein
MLALVDHAGSSKREFAVTMMLHPVTLMFAIGDKRDPPLDSSSTNDDGAMLGSRVMDKGQEVIMLWKHGFAAEEYSAPCMAEEHVTRLPF